MRYLLYNLLVVLLGCSQPKPKQINIIYILADDLGYGELGCYGQEIIETPNIDALAGSGMRFTNHYSGAPVCAPARCVLLTGQHAGHAYIRGNDEWGTRGKVWDYNAMFENPFLEGQRPLPDSILTIAEVLQQAGYTTGMVGKWGLGAPTTEGVPNKQGFDFFYGYNCQRQAHTYYPRHLWRNEQKDTLENKNVPIHANLPIGADPSEEASYANFNLTEYAPTLMHQEALGFLEAHKTEPFFLYYASPIPHLPLQAPQRWVEYYRKKLGPEEPYTGSGYFPNFTPRATYAAMISYLDEQVGELVDFLKDNELWENTLIIFSSDNGPTYTGGADTEYFDSASPFATSYGRGKGFVYEGGIRVPMIACWPGVIPEGSHSNHISAFYDIFPTLCEVADVAVPMGKDGISLLPTFQGDAQMAHDYLYWEFPSYEGQQAVRKGHWKGIRKDIFNGNLAIELYDLSKDSLELHNVAEMHPEVVQEIQKIMLEARTEPVLDRFKIEALGDVKNAYLEARRRAEEIPNVRVNLADGYFTLNRNVRIVSDSEASPAVALLQHRLNTTGAFILKAGQPGGQNNLIQFLHREDLPGAYRIEVGAQRVSIEANSDIGFMQAMDLFLRLMDESIRKEHEMHNPSWIIANLELMG